MTLCQQITLVSPLFFLRAGRSKSKKMDSGEDCSKLYLIKLYVIRF